METSPNLDLIDYVMLFALGEIYLMTLVFALVFWFKWRRLRRERQGMSAVCASVQLALQDEINTVRAAPLPQPGLQQRWLAWLESWMPPFEKDGCCAEDGWRATLENLHRVGNELTSALRRLPVGRSGASSGDEGPDGDAPKVDIDGMLESHQRSLETLSAIGRANAELTARFETSRQMQLDLRAALTMPEGLDRDRRIRELLDRIEQDNDAILAMARDSDRQRRELEAQLDELRQYIDSLEIALGHQRRLLHKMMLERDSLAEENKVTAVRLEESVKLVGRLNRTLNALQREYEKLYEMRIR